MRHTFLTVQHIHQGLSQSRVAAGFAIASWSGYSSAARHISRKVPGPSACLVVQPHDGRDAGVCKVLVVVLGRERPVTPEVLRHCGGSREGQQLAGDHPVEIAVLDLHAEGLLGWFSDSDGAWRLHRAVQGEGHWQTVAPRRIAMSRVRQASGRGCQERYLLVMKVCFSIERARVAVPVHKACCLGACHPLQQSSTQLLRRRSRCRTQRSDRRGHAPVRNSFAEALSQKPHQGIQQLHASCRDTCTQEDAAVPGSRPGW